MLSFLLGRARTSCDDKNIVTQPPPATQSPAAKPDAAAAPAAKINSDCSHKNVTSDVPSSSFDVAHLIASFKAQLRDDGCPKPCDIPCMPFNFPLHVNRDAGRHTPAASWEPAIPITKVYLDLITMQEFEKSYVQINGMLNFKQCHERRYAPNQLEIKKQQTKPNEDVSMKQCVKKLKIFDIDDEELLAMFARFNNETATVEPNVDMNNGANHDHVKVNVTNEHLQKKLSTEMEDEKNAIDAQNDADERSVMDSNNQ